MVLELAGSHFGTAWLHEVFATPLVDHHDSLAPGPAGRLDYEGLPRGQQFLHRVRIMRRPQHPVRLRHRQPFGLGQRLRAELVVHQIIEPPWIVRQQVAGVAHVDPHHSELPQLPRGAKKPMPPFMIGFFDSALKHWKKS